LEIFILSTVIVFTSLVLMVEISVKINFKLSKISPNLGYVSNYNVKFVKASSFLNYHLERIIFPEPNNSKFIRPL